MKISKNGLNLIKKYEGCRLTAYKCPAGVWTIGWGHTKNVTPGMRITQAQADAMLVQDMAKYEAKVDKYMNVYNFNQNQYDAMVSFAYNVGSIDKLTAKGTRSIQKISDCITLYNKGGGKVLPGLVKRRADEKALFNTKIAEKLPEKTEQKATTGHITYTVKKGDTLSKIARMYNMTVGEIARKNNITNINFIRIGQVLVIK